MILFRNFCIFLSKIFLRFVVSLHKGLAELLANLPALPLVLDVLRQDFVCSIVTDFTSTTLRLSVGFGWLSNYL